MTALVKKNKDIRVDEEWLKGQKKKETENTCISSLIFLIIILF